MHKAGFVNIVGNPNVGKSTLMNALVGERISIATFKAQTTRHRIMGIYNTEDMQIVFSDTPGVLKPNYKLQESMLNFSTSALVDADVLLYVTDVVETPDKNNDFVEKVAAMDVPVLLLINKIDLSNQKGLEELVASWHELLPKAEIIPLSAANRFNVDYIMKRVKELLPDSPPYFDGQACPFLCNRDYPREDSALLRQGDSLRLRGGGGTVQGRGQIDSYPCSHLCGT